MAKSGLLLSQQQKSLGLMPQQKTLNSQLLNQTLVLKKQSKKT
jgi:hypothetical protein